MYFTWIYQDLIRRCPIFQRNKDYIARLHSTQKQLNNDVTKDRSQFSITVFLSGLVCSGSSHTDIMREEVVVLKSSPWD